MVSHLDTSGAVLDGQQLGCHANHQMTICRLKIKKEENLYNYGLCTICQSGFRMTHRHCHAQYRSGVTDTLYDAIIFNVINF